MGDMNPYGLREGEMSSGVSCFALSATLLNRFLSSILSFLRNSDYYYGCYF